MMPKDRHNTSDNTYIYALFGTCVRQSVSALSVIMYARMCVLGQMYKSIEKT